MDKIRRKNAQKVVVAMSGGVDSSVAAALLKRANFNVIGVFMKFWSEPLRGSGQINADRNTDLHRHENRCCTSEAEARARKVAKILKIPFYVFNLEKEFKKKVVDYFLREYKAGRTPNPCVVCNKEIKFGLLLEKALSLDADSVATGHYARLRREIPNGAQPKAGRAVGGLESKFQIPDYKLLKAKDKEKDQSYFLWQLSQNQLKHILFPVGSYTKVQVRKLAKKFKLPVSDIPESQEICFVRTTIDDFLKNHIKEKPGPIVEQVHYGVKKIVGQHRGLWFYTIGQRKGIGLPSGPVFAKASAGKPYYVSDKDLKRNILVVTNNEKDLLKKELVVKNVNWILGKPPKFPIKIKAKIRYRHEPASATLYRLNSKVYRLRFDGPQRAITAGQSVVFYSPRSWSTRSVGSRRLSFGEALARGQGQELLGGGIIC